MAFPYLFANVTSATGAQLDADFQAAGLIGTIPCTITGTNALTLTLAANTPTVTVYTTDLRFSGIIANTNTGAVIVAVGSLGNFPVYKDTTGGPILLTGGELQATNYVVFIFDQALNSGSGGFHVSVPSSGGGAGTVTSIATNNGITGGTITATGTIGLASQPTLTLLSNITGGSAAPTGNTFTQCLDAIVGNTQGSIIYRSASAWTSLGPGSNGQLLTSQGAGANPAWLSAPGTIPYILGQSTVGMIMVGDGSMGNNGALTLTTPLTRTYANCYVYLPTNAIFTGSTPGWYFAQFSSGTAATVYNNTYTSGTPTIPGSPTPFVSTGPGAYTGVSGATTAYSLTVPGNLFGLNGGLQTTASWAYTNTANNKTLSIAYGAYTLLNSVTTTTVFNSGSWGFRNRGVANRQVPVNLGGVTSWGASATAPNYGTVDTTASQTLLFNLANGTTASNNLVLEVATVQVIPSVT